MAGALEALVDANLLESPEPDWYHLHDLLRLFAAERAQAEETPEARAEAVARLLQWYLATATAAADMLSPRRYRIPDEEPPAPGPLPGSARDAMAWYESEHANLIAAIRQAAAAGLHDVAWRLPTALFPFFNRRQDWVDCVTVHRIAVTSARLAGLRPGEAWALHHLGFGLARLGEHRGLRLPSGGIRHPPGDGRPGRRSPDRDCAHGGPPQDPRTAGGLRTFAAVPGTAPQGSRSRTPRDRPEQPRRHLPETRQDRRGNPVPPGGTGHPDRHRGRTRARAA